MADSNTTASPSGANGRPSGCTDTGVLLNVVNDESRDFDDREAAVDKLLGANAGPQGYHKNVASLQTVIDTAVERIIARIATERENDQRVDDDFQLLKAFRSWGLVSMARILEREAPSRNLLDLFFALLDAQVSYEGPLPEILKHELDEVQQAARKWPPNLRGELKKVLRRASAEILAKPISKG